MSYLLNNLPLTVMHWTALLEWTGHCWMWTSLGELGEAKTWIQLLTWIHYTTLALSVFKQMNLRDFWEPSYEITMRLAQND